MEKIFRVAALAKTLKKEANYMATKQWEFQ
jgi:hypothetical protein